MKLARNLLKLVHQLSESLSLIVTGEREVIVFENSHGLQTLLPRSAGFTAPIYSLLVDEEVGIRNLLTEFTVDP
jgi:hypothetical protein